MYSELSATPDYTYFSLFSCYFLHFRIPLPAPKLPPPRSGLKKSRALSKLIPVTRPQFLDKNAVSFGKYSALFRKKAAL